MLDQGVKVAGIDAVTFDPACVGDVRAEAILGSAPGHVRARVLPPREHDESGQAAGRTASKLSVFPIKWVNTTAAPVRAVAIIED